jgi:phosphomannomutase
MTTTEAVPRLVEFVRAYDVRGLVGTQLTSAVARALGWAFARRMADECRARAVVVAHDMRDSSPELAREFGRGVCAAGLDVRAAGLASTDMLYFASGSMHLPGAMFTASHNPAAYNGIKLCHPGAGPISLDTGLADIRDAAQALLDGLVPVPRGSGAVSEVVVLATYSRRMHDLVDLRGIRPLHVVVDTGNGMGGLTVPAVLDGAVQVHPLYFELDGTFPNHEANPLDPANLVDLQQRVVDVGADLGLAFDGDADRCFVVDERGEPVPPSAITALVALRELTKRPGATVLHNLISSRAVPELVSRAGGVPVRTRVGHSFIKAEMARTGAVFGGEHSAHYYFADFYKADTGMLAAMHVLAAVGRQESPLSAVVSGLSPYAASGEINSTAEDVPGTLSRLRMWAGSRRGIVDELDGVTVDLGGGRWFNVRPSNIEPLLRLNVEARDPAEMVALRDEVLALIRR